MSVSQPDPKGGRASLVGAGPGDPELLTLKAARIIAAADVVLYDSLVNPAILDLARPTARRIDVGKRCGRHAMSQAAINRLIVETARRGAHVVRLKGGDPFIFGRGGEELEALRAANLPVEIVPGVTAACAAAAALQIPLTHREFGRSLHFLTGHGRDDSEMLHDWPALLSGDSTVALYMGMRQMGRLASAMVAAGVAADLPVVAIENASLPGRRTVSGAIGTIAALVEAAAFDGPTLVILGRVAGLYAQTAADSEHSTPTARVA